MAELGEEAGNERDYRSFRPSARLYYAGSPAGELFLIRSGRVRLLKRARGVERTTGLFGAGELVGEDALLPGAYRSATAEAIEPVTALVIDRATFSALIRSRPSVADAVLQQLVRRLRHAEAQHESMLMPDPTIRVVHALLLEAEATEEPLFALSPLELSTRTGLDLDQVKAVVAQLQVRGYLQVGDQTITIDDASPLRELQDLLLVKEDVRHALACR